MAEANHVKDSGDQDDSNGKIFEFGIVDKIKPKELKIEKQESQKLFDEYVAFVKDDKEKESSGSLSIETIIGLKQHRLIHKSVNGEILFVGLIDPENSSVNQV